MREGGEADVRAALSCRRERGRGVAPVLIITTIIININNKKCAGAARPTCAPRCPAGERGGWEWRPYLLTAITKSDQQNPSTSMIQAVYR